MKSVNLNQDFANIQVLELYKPTEQSLEVVRGIIGSKGSIANHVVAPYGSGKSFSALIGMTLLSDDKKLKSAVLARLNGFCKDLEGFVKSNNPNLVIALSGYCPQLSNLLCEKAKIPKIANINKVITNLQNKYKHYNNIVIIWDEFGHHLDTLVREGRQEDLLIVQTLAEWAVRSSNPTVTFTTLMHKNLGFYIRGANQDIQNVWKKIEGRFDTIRLEASELDSLEIIADILPIKSRKKVKKIAEKVSAAGYFNSLDQNKISEVLARTSPLTPASLATLPQLARGFAQNDRTIQQFLQEVIILPQRNEPVGLDEVYDFFAPSLAGDTGPGGVYRRFIETESALSQTTNKLQHQVIKAICLLKLGNYSERTNLGRNKLKVGLVEGSNLNNSEVDNAIKALIQNKILLYHHHTDDISICYGTDYDLESALAEQITKLHHDFDLADGIQNLYPPEPLLSAEYNFRNSITRYAYPKYVTKSQLRDKHWLAEQINHHKNEDAVILLAIDCTSKVVEEFDIDLPQQWIVALPEKEVDLIPTFLELKAIITLQEQRSLAEINPHLIKELEFLRSSAETALRKKLESVHNPDKGKVSWYHLGKLHSIRDQATTDKILSGLFENRFPTSPLIRNEQVVRRKVSSVTKSARKRCNLAVLERSGLPHLGYEGATSSDASIYRTVFEKTGLYRKSENQWGWACSHELVGHNMGAIWLEIEQFFTVQPYQAKPFNSLFEILVSEPFGIREGLLPLLISAGIQAFGRTIAIHEKYNGYQRYLDDIQPSNIEELCTRPEQFTLTVCQFSENQLANLRELNDLFNSHDTEEEADQIRIFYDNLISWRSSLPPDALTKQTPDKNIRKLQVLLNVSEFDPIAFLKHDFPGVIGGYSLTKRTVREFKKVKEEIEGIIELYFSKAIENATSIFNARITGNHLTLLNAAESWYRSIPQDSNIFKSLDHISNGVLNHSKNATKNPEGDRGYITILSVILLGKSPEEWIYSDIQSFNDHLIETLDGIETSILTTGEYSSELNPFVKNRIKNFIDQFGSKIGEENLKQVFDEVYKEWLVR